MNNSEIIKKMQEIEKIGALKADNVGLRFESINVKAFDENEMDGELPELYLFIGKYTDKTGKTVELELYYDKDGKQVGGNNKQDRFNYPLPTEENFGNQELQQQLYDFSKKLGQLEKDTKGMLDLQQLQKELEEIAAAVGKNVNDLGAVEFITMEELEAKQRELDEYIKQLEDDNENTAQSGNKENEQTDNENKKTIDVKPENEELKDTDFKASAIIDEKEYINEYETIESALGASGEKFDNFAFVSSDQIKDNSNLSKYTLVGIRRDGTAKIIDTVQPEMGDIGRKEHEITPSGKIEENEGNKESFRIKGTRYGFRLEDEAGTTEVNLTTEGKGIHGNETVSTPVKTYSVAYSEKSLIDLNKRHPADVDKGFDEIDKHDEDCKTTVEDIDGDPNTNSHNDWSELINSLDDEAKDVFINEENNNEKLIAMIERYWQQGLSEKQIKTNIEADAYNINREYGGPKN